MELSSVTESSKIEPRAVRASLAIPLRQSRQPKALAIIVILYLIVLHGALFFILSKSNFLQLVDRKFSSKSIEQEFDGIYKQSSRWIGRLDQNALPGSILLLGDSHLHSLDLGGMAAHVLNYAVSGETTVRLIRRLGQWRAPSTASVIFLAVGVNDFQFRDANDIIRNYERLFPMLPADTPLVAGLVFPVDERVQTRTTNDQIDKINASIRELCAEHANCTIVDAGAALRDSSGNLNQNYHAGDGLHLGAAGYAIWREALRPAFAAIRR